MIYLVWIVTTVILLAIAFNISPYLRGPAPYPPDWQWPYQFTNTFSKVWFPAIIISCIIYLLIKIENFTLQKIKKNEKRIACLLVFLGFLFQIAILYYNRAGIFVIAQRVVNPHISGYFSASLTITDIGDFFSRFNENLAQYPMYAEYHPPGAILFYWMINSSLRPFSSLFSFMNTLIPAHNDFAGMWMDLADFQKAGALFSAFIVILLTNATIIPLYFCAKLLYGVKVALRSMFIYIFVPSITLFAPLNDIFIPLFSAFSIFYFLKGIKFFKQIDFFLSGLFLFLGTFFSLTFLPFFIFFPSYLLLFFIKRRIRFKISNLRIIIYFLYGFISPVILLFVLFGLNSLQTVNLITKLHLMAQQGREYGTWLFYNLYDFFLFAGLPLSLSFIYMCYLSVQGLLKSGVNWTKLNPLLFSFLIMLAAVELSGTVRAETARIWTPFIPLLVLSVAEFITLRVRFNRKYFAGFLVLQAIQVVVFSTVLVTVW